MAATAAASVVRYAPEDHTLPKPWKGLIDDRTGYLYFWNPETNVTQYEKPTPSLPPKFSPAVSVSSSVQVQQTDAYAPPKDDDKYSRGSERVSRFSEVLHLVAVNDILYIISLFICLLFLNLL